jgi:hypothetical protein
MITPSPVWSDEFVEGGVVELSGGAATDHFDHKNPHPQITQIKVKT